MSAVMKAAEEMQISEPALALVEPAMSAHAAVSALVAAGLLQDALKIAARVLPKRYAVGWLCQSTRGQPLAIEDKAGASLAEKWVREPSEENRRAAFEFANAGSYKSLGTWIAAAAGWSSGSLAPVNNPQPVPPADHLTARAVVAATNLLAALVVDQFEERRIAFIRTALDLLASGERA